MRRVKKIITVTLLFTFLLTTFSLSGQSMHADELHSTYIEAFANEDMDAMMGLYTDNATVRSVDGSMSEGMDAIKATYKAFFENGDMTISLEKIDETELSEGYLFVSGKFMLHGGEATQNGIFVNTLVKDGDTWKMLKSYRFSTP